LIIQPQHRMLHRLPKGRSPMNATALYRTASALLVVAAAGNTYGVVRFWQAGGALNLVPLPEDHRVSHGPVVLALGVFCSLCVVFAAYLAWNLGTLARTTPQAIGALGWALFAYHLRELQRTFWSRTDSFCCTCNLHWLGCLADKRCTLSVANHRLNGQRPIRQ
jgi:hypothetical protein